MNLYYHLSNWLRMRADLVGDTAGAEGRSARQERSDASQRRERQAVFADESARSIARRTSYLNRNPFPGIRRIPISLMCAHTHISIASPRRRGAARLTVIAPLPAASLPGPHDGGPFLRSPSYFARASRDRDRRGLSEGPKRSGAPQSPGPKGIAPLALLYLDILVLSDTSLKISELPIIHLTP